MATKTASLFDMTAELKSLLEGMEEWAETHEGDVSAFPLDRLEQLEGDVKAKVLKCAYLYKEWKALGQAIKAEEGNLAKRRLAHDARGDRLKEYMASCLPANAKFEDAFTCVSWEKNPAAVELLVDVKDLPELYQRWKDPEADKAELKAAMVEFQVPEVDAAGAPVLDAEGKPVLRAELQVRWPMPTGEKKTVPHPETGAPIEVDVLEEKPIARMVQGRSLNIK